MKNKHCWVIALQGTDKYSLTHDFKHIAEKSYSHNHLFVHHIMRVQFDFIAGKWVVLFRQVMLGIMHLSHFEFHSIIDQEGKDKS